MLEMEADVTTRARPYQRVTKCEKRKDRSLWSYIPVATAILGVTLVISSVVFFFVEDDLRRLVSVTFGLAILMTSVWFAANPFIHDGRRYLALREEVDEFIRLVRELNLQALEMGPPEDIEGIRTELHEAVDHMVAEAGRTR